MNQPAHLYSNSNIISFEAQCALDFEYSIHTVDSQHLIIAKEIGGWVVTDDLGLSLFEYMSSGLSPYEAFIKSCSEHDVVKNRASLLKTVELLNDLGRTGLLAPGIWRDERVSINPSLLIYLTKRCNLRCIHCYKESLPVVSRESKREQGELTLAELKRILHEYSSINKEGNITFTGGEPFIRSEIYEVLETAKTLGHHTEVFTNGTLLGKEEVKRLEGKLDAIQISLDGASRVGNDLIRGIGTFDRILKSIDLVAKTSISLTIAITVMPQNLGDLLEHCEYLEKFLSAKRCHVRLAVVKQEGRARENCSNYHYDELEEQTRGLLAKLTTGCNLSRPPQTPRKRYNCGFGPGFHVNWNGDVYPCRELDQLKVGNVRDLSIGDIFNRVYELYLITSVDNIRSCSTCDLKYICCGGCKVSNMVRNGSFIEPACTQNDRENIYRKMVGGYKPCKLKTRKEKNNAKETVVTQQESKCCSFE